MFNPANYHTPDAPHYTSPFTSAQPESDVETTNSHSSPLRPNAIDCAPHIQQQPIEQCWLSGNVPIRPEFDFEMSSSECSTHRFRDDRRSSENFHSKRPAKRMKYSSTSQLISLLDRDCRVWGEDHLLTSIFTEVIESFLVKYEECFRSENIESKFASMRVISSYSGRIKCFNSKYLSSGGHGLVFKIPTKETEDEMVNQEEYKNNSLALKVNRWSGSDENLKREYAILQKIFNRAVPKSQLPIVKPISFLQIKPRSYLVMKAYTGSVDDYISVNKRFNIKLTKKAGKEILTALKFLHESKDGVIIHGDIKPGNIFYDGSEPKPSFNQIFNCSNEFETIHHDSDEEMPDFVLGDFGNSIPLKKGVSSLHTNGEVTSLSYRAPELLPAEGREFYVVTPSIDIWSLGCTLYELYTGKVLFKANNEDKLNSLIMSFERKGISSKMLEADIKDPDKELCELISQMLCINPKERPSAAQLLERPFFDN